MVGTSPNTFVKIHWTVQNQNKLWFKLWTIVDNIGSSIVINLLELYKRIIIGETVCVCLCVCMCAFVCVCAGIEAIWELSVHFDQFLCKPETSLRNKVHWLKNFEQRVGRGQDQMIWRWTQFALLCCAWLLSGVRLFATPWTVCSPPGSSAHGILQARILGWVARPSSRSSQPRDQTQVFHVAGGFFIVCII